MCGRRGDEYVRLHRRGVGVAQDDLPQGGGLDHSGRRPIERLVLPVEAIPGTQQYADMMRTLSDDQIAARDAANSQTAAQAALQALSAG